MERHVTGSMYPVKKWFMRIFMMIIIGIFVCCACSCNSSGKSRAGGTSSPENNNISTGDKIKNSLIGGMWTDPETGISMEFMSNNKLHYIQVGNMSSELWLNYEIKGDAIVISYAPGNTETLRYSLKGNELAVTWENGNTSTLRRAMGSR